MQRGKQALIGRGGGGTLGKEKFDLQRIPDSGVLLNPNLRAS